MYDDVNDCFIHTHAGKSSHTLVKYNRVKETCECNCDSVSF